MEGCVEGEQQRSLFCKCHVFELRELDILLLEPTPLVDFEWDTRREGINPPPSPPPPHCHNHHHHHHYEKMMGISANFQPGQWNMHFNLDKRLILQVGTKGRKLCTKCALLTSKVYSCNDFGVKVSSNLTCSLPCSEVAKLVNRTLGFNSRNF